MTYSDCNRCKDTGYTSNRFYTVHPTCSCHLGEVARAEATMTDEQNLASIERETTIRKAEATAARHARRDARRATEADTGSQWWSDGSLKQVPLPRA